MTGAILNALGIVVGGIFGLARGNATLSMQTQTFFKVLLGVLCVFFGLQIVWFSVSGNFLHILKELGIAMLALILGRLLGKLLRFQKASNHLGQYARRLIEQAKPENQNRFGDGLNVCAVLFCAAPLGIVGAMLDGLSGYYQPLAVKALMDGLAMMGFARLFGWGAIVSALPVYVFQAAISLACHLHAGPFLERLALLDSVNAVGGFIVCTIGLVIFEVRRVELADYLPSLAVAPLLTWFWK